MSQRIYLLFVLFLPLILVGQVLSNQGRFSVEFDKGCNPMTVNITELDTFGNVTRQYFYEKNSNITNSTTYTYTSAKSYEIIQISKGSLSDTLQVEVFDPFHPNVRIEKCSGNEISITSEEKVYDFIRIYFGGPDSVQLNRNESITHTFASSTLQAIGVSGFFQDANENCSDYLVEVAPIPSLPSPTISSVSIKESCKDLFVMYLELTSFDSLTTYQVELNQTTTTLLYEGTLSDELLIIPNVPFSTLQDDYCVQVNALDPCNSSRVDGTPVCKESSNLSLSPFESLYSSYESDGIRLNLDPISSGIFNVFRRRENQSFQREDSVTSSYTDAIGSAARAYFYKIDYVDSCNQVLFSAETNPPFIKAKKTSKNTYTVDLSLPNPLSEGAYVVQAIVGDGVNASTHEFTIVKSATTEDTFHFELELNAKDGTRTQRLTTKISSLQGQIVRQSNTILLKFDIILYVPSAFTPNNDGLNDTLEIFGLPSNNASITIYSKWGHLIYASNNIEMGWDGQIDGKVAPGGTYLYEIIFESSEGEKLRQKGTFALIKK